MLNNTNFAFFFLPILFFLLNGVRGKIPNGKKWKLKTWNNFLPFFYSSFIQNSFIQKNRFFNFVKYTCHATIFILYTTKGHEIYRPSCGCVRSSAFRWVPWVDTSAWVFHHVLAIKVVAFFWLFFLSTNFVLLGLHQLFKGFLHNMKPSEEPHRCPHALASTSNLQKILPQQRTYCT